MGTEINKELEVIIDATQATHHNIRIELCNRGYVVHIGCTSWAFEKKESMLQALSLFLDDPDDTTAYFNERYSELLGVDQPAPEQEIGIAELSAMRATATRVGYPE